MKQQFEKSSDLLVLLLTIYGMNVLGAIVTLMVGLGLAGWLSRLADRARCKADTNDAVFHPLPGKTVRTGVIALMLIDVLNRLGVGTTSLIALLGATGLAIGLALQGTLGKVASGVMIPVFRPFKIRDVVKLGRGVHVIDSLGGFVGRAHLPDGPIAFLPNSKICVLITFLHSDHDSFFSS